jgi:hypothetical protein
MYILGGMKRIISVFFIALLAGVAHGVTITGQVVDSASALPLSGVSVTFRLGGNPEAYPKTTTDATGRFSKDITAEPGFPLQVLFERSDCLIRIVTVTVAGDTIDLGQFRLVKPAEFIAYFCGKVLDSATRKELAGTQILLKRKWGDSEPFLQCTTDTKGEFGISVPVSGDMNGKALWYIAIPGYYTTSGYVTASMDSVSQTILLRAEGSIRVQVSGKVVNSQTRMPVPNARVILSTNYLEVKPDTSTTGADGLFNRSVQAGDVSAAIPAVGYRITAPGYVEKTGQVVLGEQTEVDFGEIELTNNTGVMMPAAMVPANGGCMRRTKSFMLNGRELFLLDSPGKSRGRVSQGSQVIVDNQQKKPSFASIHSR